MNPINSNVDNNDHVKNDDDNDDTVKDDDIVERIFWKVGDTLPPEFISLQQPVLDTLIPRTLAWMIVDDDNNNTNNPRIALIDGYTASCYTPPALHFAISCIPTDMFITLQKTKKCTLSAATTRESMDLYHRMYNKQHQPLSYRSNELHLQCSKIKDDYPPSIQQSPIKMHCVVEHIVWFDDDNDDNNNNNNEIDIDESINEKNEKKKNHRDGMIVLIVESFVVDGSVLSAPTESMIQRNITAKIDAELISPIIHLGNGNYTPMKSIKSMPRPKYNEQLQQWTSTNLLPVVTSTPTPTTSSTTMYPNMEWEYRIHGGICPLGFNATTALVMPRPIGWISTYYTKDTNILHIAPYSFFIDISRGNTHPRVAFSAYRKGENGTIKKDAQFDTEENKCFCYNTVTEELIVPMNYTAAELERNGSEFQLAQLQHRSAQLIHAPIVTKSKITYECQYIKTIDVDQFSIVIGEVIGVWIDKDILNENGTLNLQQLRPIARLGYMDEYGLFF